MAKKLVGIVFLMSSLCAVAANLIPMPVEVENLEGSLRLSESVAVAYADEEAGKPAELLAHELGKATGMSIPVHPGQAGPILLKTTDDPEFGEEGYSLRVTEGVIMEASNPAGLFYATQTLLQLLPVEVDSSGSGNVDWEIPCVRIRDRPRFAWRGMHLDVSRHFMPKADVLKFIDTIASLKFNKLHLHLTDDQGWRIEIKKYPRLTEVGGWRDETLIGHMRDNRKDPKFDGVPHGGYYTQEDIREIVSYAQSRYITIVPEIDMPGHMQAAIAAYPELGCTGEEVGVRKKWGISEYILNPEESTVQFCKDVLREVMNLFPSEFIHIGGDEARKKQWEGSERIQALRKKRGLADMHEMQAWFIGEIGQFLQENGRRLIGWDEITEGGLTQDAALMWWRAKAVDDVMEAIREGHDVVVAKTKDLYFDYYQSRDKASEPLAIGGYLPLEHVYHFEPVPEGLEPEYAGHILGAQGQLWREYLPTTSDVEYMAFPRACALAEVLWLPVGSRNYQSFLERMKVQERRFAQMNVNFRKLETADQENSNHE
jgi:hexosaminidase